MNDHLRGLYALTDSQLITDDALIDTMQKTIQGGANIIQYRDKSSDQKRRLEQAQALGQLCKQHDVLFIINDDPDLAIAVDADGVHIGKQDADYQLSREKLGADKIIGVSCYNDFSLAQRAARQGADYIAFGSFYVSPTKPDAIRADISLLQQAKQLQPPVCAIGGITHDNAAPLIEAGADMIAVISELYTGDDIEQQTRAFCKLFY